MVANTRHSKAIRLCRNGDSARVIVGHDFHLFGGCLGNLILDAIGYKHGTYGSVFGKVICIIAPVCCRLIGANTSNRNVDYTAGSIVVEHVIVSCWRSRCIAIDSGQAGTVAEHIIAHGCHRAGNSGRSQIVAANKCISTDSLHAFGKGDGRELHAIGKGVALDSRQLALICISKGHRFQVSTQGKRLSVNARHRFGDGNSSQIRTLIECLAKNACDTILDNHSCKGCIVLCILRPRMESHLAIT